MNKGNTDVQTEREPKPTFGLFVANHIDTNTAETFRNGVWYTRDERKTRLDIVPMTLRQFRDYFVSIFKYGRHTNGEIVGLMKHCIERRDDFEAPEWQTDISRGISKTICDKRRASMEIVDVVDENKKYCEFLPFYDTLRAACGAFGDEQEVSEPKWIRVDGIGRLDDTMYVVQAVGHSMEPDIEDGDLCVMRKIGGANYENRIVLVQHNDINDFDTGGAYTIKKFTRAGENVVLVPSNREFQDIVIRNNADYDVSNMLVGVLHRKL